MQYALPLTISPVAQQYITSSAAGIVNAMTPITVVLVSHFWPGGENATWSKSIGVAVGFLGMIVVIWPEFEGQGSSNPWAMLLAILAPVCYAITGNILRWLDDLGRIVMTAWSLLFGAIILVPLALITEGLPVITRAETWGSLAAIGFVSTSAAFIILYWLIPKVGPTSASAITYIAPISAIGLGVLFLSERLLFVQGIGMAIIVVGLLFSDGRIFGLFRKAQPSG